MVCKWSTQNQNLSVVLDPIQTLKIVVFDSGFFDRWYDIAKKKTIKKARPLGNTTQNPIVFPSGFLFSIVVFFLADLVANQTATILAINLNQRSKYHADHVAQAAGAVHPRPGPIRRATLTMRPTVSRAGDGADAGGGAAAADSAGPSASAPLTAWAGPPRGPTASPRAVPSRRRRG